MNKRRVIFTLCTLLVSGCAHVLVRPAADKVQKIAVVSAYVNREMYDIEAPKAAAGGGLGALVKAAATAAVKEVGLDALSNDLQPVIVYGLKQFVDKINETGRWQVLGPEVVAGNPAYQEFFKAGYEGIGGQAMSALAKVFTSDFVSPEGMLTIPLAKLADGTHRFGDDPNKDFKDRLAKLATELDVDAVAILELDSGYEKGFAITGGIIGNKQRGSPSVSLAAVAVDRDGQLVLNTGPIRKGEGDRYEGDTVWMFDNKRLQMDDPKVVSAFNDAIGQAVAAFHEDLVKELAEIPRAGPPMAGPPPAAGESESDAAAAEATAEAANPPADAQAAGDGSAAANVTEAGSTTQESGLSNAPADATAEGVAAAEGAEAAPAGDAAEAEPPPPEPVKAKGKKHRGKRKGKKKKKKK